MTKGVYLWLWALGAGSVSLGVGVDYLEVWMLLSQPSVRIYFTPSDESDHSMTHFSNIEIWIECVTQLPNYSSRNPQIVCCKSAKQPARNCSPPMLMHTFSRAISSSSNKQ